MNNDKFLPYQSSWKDKFQKEKEKLQDVFGKEALAIEHIGSTSIEGLSAKPIIDMAVLVNSIEDIDRIVLKLNPLNYIYQSNFPPGERIWLRKGNPVEYHLSIVCPKHTFWERNILFRDYLRNHPEFIKEYEDLKKNNLKITPEKDLEDLSHSKIYNQGKGDFVKKILDLAREENKKLDK